ncbi:MAG: hypothetical protein ABR607_11550 [Pyrinomonadaceae bacterium]
MPKTIIAVVDDLFFASKIRGTAGQLGVNVTFPRKIEAVMESALQNRPALVIVDLHGARVDPIELGKQLKADERLRDIPMIGFFSHVQAELQRQALEAGFDRVLPRSVFTRELADILSGRQI